MMKNVYGIVKGYIVLLKERRGKKNRESARQLIGYDHVLRNKRVLQVTPHY
jgi:hypothetical protein